MMEGRAENNAESVSGESKTEQMNHSIEVSPSGRAKCRGCGKAIAKGELRLGEKLPNPFAEGEMSIWFHLQCGAYKRPEILLHALERFDDELSRREQLIADANESAAHLRLPRIDGVERAPSGRARCRHCRETIEKGEWRIGLVFYEEGRFNPSGYCHTRCASEYLGTSEIVERLRFFTPELTDAEEASIREGLG